jgi:2-phosphosulfolactate phosphatase
MAVALSRGASAIYPIEQVADARYLLERFPDAITVGAIGGGDPIPEFDFGNSPSKLSETSLDGKSVVLSTVAGIHGLYSFRHTSQLYAASLVCARATASAILATEAQEVCFVITGEWTDRDGDEDIACADYIEGLLCGNLQSTDQFSDRVRNSDFGRRFLSGHWPNLPCADLEIAAKANLFDFSMPVKQEGTNLVVRAAVITKEVDRS